jgi:hypothetical protein
MNKYIKYGIFPLIGGNMKLFAAVLVLMMALVPSASATCTALCYVDDDGTGDYNVDHREDETQINQAIAQVSSYATATTRGIVILNQTSKPYEIKNNINMIYDYVTLKGENTTLKADGNQSVELRLARDTPNIANTWRPSFIKMQANDIQVKNLHFIGNVTANRGYNGFYQGSSNGEIIRLMSTTPNKQRILIENISAYDSTDDIIYGSAGNLTIRNLRGTHIGHAGIYVAYYGSGPANHLIENIYCNDLVNACVRFDKMIGATIRNVYAIDPDPYNAGGDAGYYTQFAIELDVGESTGSPQKDIYIENVTAMYPVINGIWIMVDPTLTSAWYIQNVTFKNILIDCWRACNMDSGNDYQPNDRPGAIRVQSATDIVFDGVTILNASTDGFRIANYVTRTSNIAIKNSIIINNSKYGIHQVNGNTNFNWNIHYNDIWNNGIASTGGSVTPGNGNFDQNPQFASGYHLKSQYGRWTGTAWTTDSVTSPAIDAGDPTSDFSNEPAGNGGRINIGFDGNTKYASKSASGNYSISGYVFDNNNDLLPGVSVINPDNEPYIVSATTNSAGFFTITGVLNGNYNLSYSKSGFNTGYLNITINDISNSTANKTIYDTTAPSITGLTATKTNSSTVTLSYDATGSWYKIYRDGSLRTTTRSNSWIDPAVSVDNTYQYTVSANDTYGNQGSNSSVNITIYSYAVTNLTPLIDTAIESGQPGLSRGSNTWIDPGRLSGSTYGNYRGLLYSDVSTIPSSAKINSAILTLTWEGGNRNQTTVICVFRPSSLWNTQYASWNNMQNSLSWKTQGGDWIDRNGVSYGSSPYAEVSYPAGSTTNAILNVTSIIQEYVFGNYPNTGFFLKANEIENSYISFHSSEASNASQRPKLTVYYTTGDTPSNPAPSITAFSPSGLTPQYTINISSSFTVTTDQSVSNTWYLNGINQNTGIQTWLNIWSLPGQYNVTYVGSNSNGSVSMTWNVLVVSMSMEK